MSSPRTEAESALISIAVLLQVSFLDQEKRGLWLGCLQEIEPHLSRCGPQIRPVVEAVKTLCGGITDAEFRDGMVHLRQCLAIYYARAAGLRLDAFRAARDAGGKSH